MPTPTTRRAFVAKASATFAAFNIVPPNVLGGQHTPPSEIMGTATIGTGGRGMGFVRNDPKRPTLAVCDIDSTRRERAREKAGPLCTAYNDFREVLDRDDIDQVFIATPPHWHAIISIMAAKAGMHVMCEKPLARTIGEGRAVVNAIRRYGCNFRYGAYCTGTPAELAAKAYHSGLLGRPLTVYQAGSLGCPFKVRQWTGLVDAQTEVIPDHIDWDMYCGPSPLRPFQRHRHGGSHRGYWDYDGGGVSDMGGHILNCIVGAIDKGHTSPVAIETDAPPADEQAVGVWHTGSLRYADGTTIVMDSGVKPDATPAAREGLYLEGPEGKLFLDKNRRPRTEPAGLLAALNAYELPYSIRSTTSLRDPVEIVTHAHHAIAVVHLLNISIRMGRPIKFDPVNEVIVGDDQANALINQPMRAPWHI